jgi:glutamyl-tRNA synthetase
MIRTRIAPSPTGLAHIGTAYYAIYNYAFAKQNNGKFVVRIEDTDRARFVEGSEKVIFDALSWLGIPHDEGPDLGGPYGPYRQSERLDIYRKHAEELIKKSHAYYCFCSPERLEKIRKEMQENKQIPRYDRHCRTISISESTKRVENGEKHVIRMIIPDGETIGWDDLVRGRVEFSSDIIDDQVIIKSDGFPTYHLAVVVDDYLMKITHVLRGEEWTKTYFTLSLFWLGNPTICSHAAYQK